MAYGRIYIESLRKKVTLLFDEMKATGMMGEKNFINLFKQKYPKDYAMLVYEWEFKVHEFKKNRKGNPKPHPIRPEKILSNMYRNYYFKLVKHPIIKEQKHKSVNNIRCMAGIYGFKIRDKDNGKYDVVNKKTKEVERENITYKEVKDMFSPQGIHQMKSEGKELKADV